MSRLYLDANVVIRLMEDDPASRDELTDTLAAHGGPEAEYVVTDVVRLECRVKPMAVGDAGLLEAYRAYFASGDVTVVDLPSQVWDRATEIRARYRYGLADALHLAAAIEAGCDLFVTADKRLAGFPGVELLLIEAA